VANSAAATVNTAITAAAITAATIILVAEQ
jgi:hypothetical protein